MTMPLCHALDCTRPAAWQYTFSDGTYVRLCARCDDPTLYRGAKREEIHAKQQS